MSNQNQKGKNKDLPAIIHDMSRNSSDGHEIKNFDTYVWNDELRCLNKEIFTMEFMH